MIRRYLPQSTEDVIRWYERYVSPISLIVGFSIDLIAVQFLSVTTYSVVLFFYLILAATCVLLLHLVQSGRVRIPDVINIAPFLPVIAQYAFGGLLSGFILLYSKSASLSLNWVFIVILACLLLGNERFRRVYTTFPVQVGILYFCVFSFFIFYVPVYLQTVGQWLFLMSGVVSLIAITGFLVIAFSALSAHVSAVRGSTLKIIVGIFLTVNALHYLGIIPPLPLALRDAGVFHSIVREGDTYVVSYEPIPWYKPYLRYNTEFQRAPGEKVYVYTAVFAPSGITTSITHEWQFFDTNAGTWVTKSTVQFPVSGGRDGGYRGYSFQDETEAGHWRVNVQTSYGALIGRVSFVVTDVAGASEKEAGER